MPATLMPWPILKKPMQGPPTRALQHLMRHHGHDNAADGIFGPETEAAVEAFQQAEHLVVDGIAGPKTLAAAIVTVRKGDKGPKAEAVKAAQVLVDVTVDGDFGPKTDAAVRYWQDNLGLVVDGIVGPKTWQALFGAAD
jgi:peptidoglycan hydrolase-like protein with peptidoglycan-binding domain